jgi:hypothetical protein
MTLQVIQSIANGQKSVSRILKEAQRIDSGITLDDVKDYVNEHGIAVPNRIKPTYEHVYEQRHYKVYWSRECPKYGGGGYDTRLEEMDCITASTAKEALGKYIASIWVENPSHPHVLLYEGQVKTKESLIVLPLPGSTAKNFLEGKGLVTDETEKPNLLYIERTTGDVVERITEEQKKIDKADWQYPDDHAFLTYYACVWTKIRNAHGSDLVHKLVSECNPLSPAKFWVTEKKFKRFLACLPEIVETGKSPRPITSYDNIELSEEDEGLIIKIGWKKVCQLVCWAAILN